jgi:hypothetical protein
LTSGAPPVETIVIEDLNFAGMSKNHALAGVAGNTKSAVEERAAMRGCALFDTTSTRSACGGYSMILGHDKTALDPKPAQAPCLCRGCIVFADWFFPSRRICSCCGAITGPKGREEFNVERWICRESGIRAGA